MKSNNRMTRINDEIKKEVAEIIQMDLKDPRIQSLVSVTRVETTTDLQQSKISISVFGDENRQQETMEAIESASGFIRKEIAKRINLRITPKLLFQLDDSMAYGARMTKLIEEVNQPKGSGQHE